MKKNKRLSILQILKTSSLIAIFILGLEASALKENPIVISGLEVKAETEVLEAYKKAQLAKENLEEILSYFLNFGASGKKPTPDKTDLEEIYRELPLKE